jgi:hypothetical protein
MLAFRQEPGQEEGGLLMGTHGATGQKALGHGMHFDWGLDVCFFKVVSGIQRGLFFFWLFFLWPCGGAPCHPA